MINIIDGETLTRALNASLNPCLTDLLRTRCDQLGGDIAEHAHFVVVQRADTAESVEQQLGFSAFQNPFDGSRFGDPDFTPAWGSRITASLSGASSSSLTTALPTCCSWRTLQAWTQS